MKRTVVMLLALLLPSLALAQTPAFYGAEGYGRLAEGGRGGDVYIVTSLADSGPNTLRECVEASGPRTCVFEVFGDIFLDSALIVTNPFLTVAGQTAPGQGIQLRQGQNLASAFNIETNDVVIRHIKLRTGPTVQNAPNNNCVNIGTSSSSPQRIVVDHVSCMFGTDGLMQLSPGANPGANPGEGAKDVTFSNILQGWGLHNSTHTKPQHSKGMNLRGCGVSIINNVIANSVIRMPNVTCGIYDPSNLRGGGLSGDVEFRNNIVFGGRDHFLHYWNGRGESWLNVAGSLFIKGSDTKVNNSMPYGVDAIDIFSPKKYQNQNPPSGTTDPQHLCLQDNVSDLAGTPGAQDGSLPDALYGVLAPNDAHLVESTDCVNNPVGAGLTGALIPSGEVMAYLVANVGAKPWDRDTLDQKLLDDMQSGIGFTIDHPSEVGGWPTLVGGTAPVDTDRDGMSDAFELACGFDPNDAADRNDDHNSNVFTNLEEYLAVEARDVELDDVCNAPVNLPPVANAGPDQNASVHELVTLDGSASSDPELAPLTYSWSLTAKPPLSAVDLAGAGTVAPTLTPDFSGSYLVELIVNDGELDSPMDDMTITVTNLAPTAVAGADQTVQLDDTVMLMGQCLDPEGAICTYDWEITSQPPGSVQTIVDTETTQFIATHEGVYEIDLIVNDGEFSSAPDSLTVTVQAAPPPTCPAVGASVTMSQNWGMRKGPNSNPSGGCAKQPAICTVAGGDQGTITGDPCIKNGAEWWLIDIPGQCAGYVKVGFFTCN